MKKYIILLFCALFITCCSMKPTYNRPEFPVSDKWNLDETSQKPLIKNTKAAKDIAWQAFFKSPGIQKVIKTALLNNRDLRIAALNIEATQALYRIKRADFMPSIALIGEGTKYKPSEIQSPFGKIISTYTANTAITAFELDLFGRIQSQNQAALETYFATQAAFDTVKISLIAEVANSYLQWLSDQKILALVKSTLETQKKSHNLILKSHENGVASKLDVAQVTQSVATAEAALAFYSRRVKQDENSLLLLMGVKTLNPILKTRTLDKVLVLQKIPVKLPSEVLLIRPDVRQAEHELLSANANIGVARAAFFPIISLTGNFGYASPDLSNLFSNAASNAWTFVPQIAVPIFQGEKTYANLDYSVLNKKKAIANYEKTIQRAFKEVSDELANLNTINKELEAQRKLVKATQEAYDLSYLRYKKGIDSFLNVLDAQRSLFSAQQKEIEIEKLHLTNLVNLYKTLGGGLN